ncbi:flagellar assembly protein FliW [Aquibacillus albus]|uniref:Flagellar assembly factor FliW n=1 Tax=Aquibacillus albus TaxID=1168171 RepID=A0ABS2MWS8_9BACI|nr:flagellar assembly protein FliW [Aquibacillus albus]MBM7570243.1 flagellar assembly factor FliW [Aquibacillus albus]
MNINTKYFGEISIKDEDVIHFPHGIPGFLDEKEFALLDLEDNPVFQVLQSISNVSLAFIVTNPYHFLKEYEFELDQNTMELLHIESEKDVVVLSIVSLKDPFEESTVNLQAPIIINNTKKRGKQYITNINEFSTKVAIFSQNKSFQVKED